MKFNDISSLRLVSQHIIQSDFSSAHDVVSYMGAMQAQDYSGSLWSIGLRTSDLTYTDIEQAIISRNIVRTWPMRGTLHFVASEDIRWMLSLLAPRMTTTLTSRQRQLELDEVTMTKSRSLIESALQGGNCLTRNELCALLEAYGISTIGQRGIHILMYLSIIGVLCFGPHQGKQPTFVLLEEWIKPTNPISYEEALVLFATRYFLSHGPASLKDFAGWGKITLGEARLAIQLAGSAIEKTTVDSIDLWHSSHTIPTKVASSVFLLPGFDEFMLGYKDRTPSLSSQYAQRIVPGNNGMFLSTIVANGKVVGTWKKVVRKSTIEITLHPFETIDDEHIFNAKESAERYGRFIEMPVTVTVS